MNKKLFLRLLGPIIFLFIVYFYVDLNQLREIVAKLIWYFYLLSILLCPLLILVRSFRWHRILAKYDIFYSVWQCFRIYFVEMLTIMVVATIGTFIKAAYLKRDGHGLLRPTLSVIGEKYFDFLLPLVFGVTSAILIVLKLQPDLCLIILLFVTFLMFAPARKFIRIFDFSKIPTFVKKMLPKSIWNSLEHIIDIERVLDFNTYALSVAGFAIYYLTIFLLAIGLRIDLSFSQIVLIMTVTSLISLIPLSFFGIGTRDAGLLIVFNWFNHTPEEAIALSMALLLVRIAVVFMGSIFWFMDPLQLTKLKRIRQ